MWISNCTERSHASLQSAWTDEVLEKAVAQLPAEWRAVDNGAIVRALKARRAELVQYVERFYKVLADRVDIHLTDENERVTIRSPHFRQTEVMVTVTGAATPHFTRTFDANDTREIRIHVHGGEDRIEHIGVNGDIHVRIIADEGTGTKTVQSPGFKTEVWADPNNLTGEKVSRRDPWVNPMPLQGAPWIEPRNYGATTIVQPTAWYATDVGFVLGASITRTSYGFRSVPFSKKQTLRGGWAFGTMSGKISYHGIFARPASSLAFDFRTFASGIEQFNYFGLGNETPQLSSSQYRSQQRMVAVAPSLLLGSTDRFQLTIGPEYRHMKTYNDASSQLSIDAPYGSGDFGSLRLKGTIAADTRQLTTANVLDMASGTGSRQPADQPPGSGIRFLGSAYVAPAVLDVENVYGGVEGEVAAYIGSSDIQFALRVGGGRVFGDQFPYFDASYLGGATDRGYRDHRFGGHASLYGNAELRMYLTKSKYESVFPVRFGVIGFVDDGRVWLSGEDSNAWHPSAGGGILLKAVGTPIVIRAVVARSPEETLFYFGSGFRF